MLQFTPDELRAFKHRLKQHFQGPFLCTTFMRQPDGDNDLKQLPDEFSHNNGLYLFTLTDTDRALYIGSAHKQDLVDRMSQHLCRSSGGDFRNAVMNDPDLDLWEQARRNAGLPMTKTKTPPEELAAALKNEALRYIRDHTQVYLAITKAEEASSWEPLAILLFDTKYNTNGKGKK